MDSGGRVNLSDAGIEEEEVKLAEREIEKDA